MPVPPEGNGRTQTIDPRNDSQPNGTLESNSETKNDPNVTELDPCLDQNDSKKKKLPFYDKYISDLQEKTGLPRKWVLVLLGLLIGIGVLVGVVFVMAVGWPRVPHMFNYPVCRSAGCLRAAAQLQENLDSSVSPCTNLWNAVCSSWAKNSTRPLDRAVWNQKEMLLQKESERTRNLIATLELPLHTGTVEWKLKHFYEACLDVDTLSIDDTRPLTNIISVLGGWYILRDFNDADFKGMAVLQNLQVRYGVSSFFKIHVEPDPHVPNIYSVRISPSGLGLPDKEYYFRDNDDRIVTAYKDYIRDVLIYLGTPRNDATKFGTDIFSYEKRIADITPDLITLQNPITTYNAISLSELKHTINLIPFYDILQAMFPETSISENTEVIVTSLEYLSQVSQIIATTDRRTLNGYLIWTLVRKYIPFLSDKYTSAMNAFHSELYGMSKPKPRWEFCASLVRDYMGLAVEYLEEKRQPISEKTKRLVNDTFNEILNVVKEKVTKLDDTALLLQHLEAKLNILNIYIGLPKSTKTPEFIQDHFKSLKIIKANFFESICNAIVFQRKVEQKMLLNTLPEGIFIKEALSDLKVKYLPSKNAVFIPRTLVLEPYFESDFPSSIIYGRLGQEIAHTLVESVLPYGSLWTSDKKILSPFHMTVNESVNSVQKTTTCLARYILNLYLDVPAFRANETALNLVKELTSLKIANEALLTKLGNEQHTHQGGLEKYEDSALFFITYAQTQCSETTSQYQLYDNTVNFRLSQKSVLHISWAQLSDFQKALDCSPNKKIQCDDIF